MSDTKSSDIQQHSSGVDAACKPSSHDLASNLIALAEWLKSRPAFEIDASVYLTKIFNYNHGQQFRDAVRAMGSGQKGNGITDRYFRFTANTPADTTLGIEIDRSSICKLVEPAKPAVYACDPLLADSESSNG